MTRPVLLLAGAGPGVSGSLAKLCAQQGHDLALLGIEAEELARQAEMAQSLGAKVSTAVVNLTDEDPTRAQVTAFGEEFGALTWVHFNPSAFREKDPLTLRVSELLEDVALGVGALLTVTQAARPFMRAGGRVTVTGSMAADKPWNRAASLGVQKAGVRNLVHSLDTTLAPDGIRATSVTVQGALSKDGTFTPDAVAQALWGAAHQDEASWASEVSFTG